MIAVICSIYSQTCINELHRFYSDLKNQSVDQFMVFMAIDGPVDNEVYHFMENCILRDRNWIVLQYNENAGLAKRLNDIINYIDENYDEVDFLARADTDDRYSIDRLKTQKEYLDTNNDIHIVGSFAKVKLLGKEYLYRTKIHHEEIIEACHLHTPILHPTAFFRFSLFQNGLRYRTGVGTAEDLFLWYDALCMGAHFANVSQPLMTYNLNHSTMNRRRQLKKIYHELQGQFLLLNFKKKYRNLGYATLIMRAIVKIFPNFVTKIVYRIRMNF